MQLAKPQVHLKKQNSNGKYHIHVVTWMDQTRFKQNGYESISANAVGGVYKVVLKIIEDSSVPDMNLLTPIVHTVTLTGIHLSSTTPFIEVNVFNTTTETTVGKTKTHQDDADDSGMPSPRLNV